MADRTGRLSCRRYHSRSSRHSCHSCFITDHHRKRGLTYFREFPELNAKLIVTVVSVRETVGGEVVSLIENLKI